MNAAVNTPSAHGAKALRSAYFCYFLAALIMLVTAWVIVQGIEATEPASSARNAKVASGVLLLVLEGCAFSLAGQWREFSFVLRMLGWSIFGLQITLMTLANYSVGATAGKAAAHSKENSSESREQAKEDREKAKESRAAAAALRAEAQSLRKSKDPAAKEKAAQKAAEAADFSKASLGAAPASAPSVSAAANSKAEAEAAAALSTPWIETIGETGLLVLSGVLSIIMECAGIVLMHVAGSLRRKASVGVMPVDEQILELLHRIHGTPAGTAGTVPAQSAPAPALTAPTPLTMPVQAAPVAPVAPVQAAVSAPFSFIGFKKVPAAPIGATPAPAPVTFKPAGTVAPSGFSFSSKTALAGAGALAAMAAAPVVQAAPAPVHEKAPAAPAERVNVDMAERVNVHTPSPMKTGVFAPVNGDVLTSSERVNDDTPEHVNDDTPEAPAKARKERVARDGAVMDSGTGPLDGFRYRRAVAGVKVGKIQTTIIGMYDGVGVSAPTAKRFLEAMADAGVVVRKGNRYALAEKYRLKLVKKGSAK